MAPRKRPSRSEEVEIGVEVYRDTLENFCRSAKDIIDSHPSKLSIKDSKLTADMAVAYDTAWNQLCDTFKVDLLGAAPSIVPRDKLDPFKLQISQVVDNVHNQYTSKRALRNAPKDEVRNVSELQYALGLLRATILAERKLPQIVTQLSRSVGNHEKAQIKERCAPVLRTARLKFFCSQPVLESLHAVIEKLPFTDPPNAAEIACKEHIETLEQLDALAKDSASISQLPARKK